MINVFQPSLGDEELAATRAVFESGWLGKGPLTAEFEKAWGEHLGVDPRSVIWLSSCTSALFLTMQLMDLDEGDEVVLPSASFVAAANAIASSGAKPVFCDVDPRTLNPSVQNVADACSSKTKAVVILHYGGYPGEVSGIAELCRNLGIRLVEDAACAPASRVDSKRVGTFGDFATWSFDAMKILSTGDGGMLYVKDPELADRARRLAYHGLEQSSGFSKAQVSHRWWDLEVAEFAGRIVGNDLTASLGLVQLSKLDTFVARRAEIVNQYNDGFGPLSNLVVPPPLPEGHVTSHYFYWVQVDPSIRDELASALLKKGIYTTFRYPPLHRVSAFGSSAHLPNTDRASDSTLCLPLHQGLSNHDAGKVISEVAAVLGAGVQ